MGGVGSLERTTRRSRPGSWVKAVGWGEKKADPSVRESATAGREFQQVGQGQDRQVVGDQAWCCTKDVSA